MEVHGRQNSSVAPLTIVHCVVLWVLPVLTSVLYVCMYVWPRAEVLDGLIGLFYEVEDLSMTLEDLHS